VKTKIWRKENIEKILESNRKRILLQKGVKGSHTEEEWYNKKKEYGFRCAKCGIQEEKLQKLWSDTNFTQLTKDHIIPISKKGTDNIENIQPLCISCNAKKRDKINATKSGYSIAVSGGMDVLHKGHIRMIKEAKQLLRKMYGENGELIVILNNNNWLIKKKGFYVMDEHERKEILEELASVDQVVITKHSKNTKDMSVCEELKNLQPTIFANGGDRKADNIPEYQLCEKLGINMIFNVGGDKVQSSSHLIKKNDLDRNFPG